MAGENTATFAAGNAQVITPSDTASIPQTRAIYVGGLGNLAVQMIGGQTVTFTACPVGLLLPIQVSKIMATNTTASNIIAVW